MIVGSWDRASAIEYLLDIFSNVHRDVHQCKRWLELYRTKIVSSLETAGSAPVSGRRRIGCTCFVPAPWLSVVSCRLSPSSSRNHSRIRRMWQTDSRRLQNHISLSVRSLDNRPASAVPDLSRTGTRAETRRLHYARLWSVAIDIDPGRSCRTASQSRTATVTGVRRFVTAARKRR